MINACKRQIGELWREVFHFGFWGYGTYLQRLLRVSLSHQDRSEADAAALATQHPQYLLFLKTLIHLLDLAGRLADLRVQRCARAN
jgi:hypothetical protein